VTKKSQIKALQAMKNTNATIPENPLSDDDPNLSRRKRIHLRLPDTTPTLPTTPPFHSRSWSHLFKNVFPSVSARDLKPRSGTTRNAQSQREREREREKERKKDERN
jgi:hypothetical protein